MKICTTSELLNQLRVGQKAEMVEPLQDIVVTKRDGGAIVVLKDGMSTTHINQPLFLSQAVVKAKWKLEPVEVPFMEAVEHLKNGGIIRVEIDGDEYVYDSIYNIIELVEVIEGKWYLVEGEK
jgi:hypothetical protein